MAIFHLEIKPVARGRGRSATAAAAYRAGERIRDERTGTLYNHSKRDDVLHKEIFLPSRLDRSGAGMEWARDRATLWNAAENAEHQRNSRVAREYMVSLPAELSAEQRLTLARAFSREIADRYSVAVDLAIHAPRPEGDPRNFHAHLLATTREVTPEGLGPKAGLDMDVSVRNELGVLPFRQEFKTLRARWAELTNEALREANVEASIDHRSLAAQGIDREPRPQLPWAAVVAERRGERNAVAEGIRERHRQRFAEQREMRERNAHTERAEPSADAPRADGPRIDTAREPEVRPDTAAPQGMDARRRQAVRDWLKYRASAEQERGGQGHGTSPPLAMDEIRQRAVAAWRALQARGAESQHSAEKSRQEPDAARDRGDSEQARDASGLGDDFSD
jgi:ATP-dependent exoDNAse (exonuclease V) alpha subunit